MFSSVLNCMEMWSSTAFWHPESKSMQSPPLPFFPCRKRRCRMTTSSLEMRTVPSLSKIPSPGAVWPAMVNLFDVIRVAMPPARWIAPETANTTVRPPAGIVVTPSKKEPGPEEFVFVTT
jgi:hypothetical protein